MGRKNQFSFLFTYGSIWREIYVKPSFPKKRIEKISTPSPHPALPPPKGKKVGKEVV
jgi:hypothetical protein